ncbi:5-oxoprolinase subunit PxpA [Lacibacter sediminis]|uniref:LamB/YcsF family protein n=1 Tax=Lacibacter sediminis TaxID=2760713 RepID=A0A7G5XLF6_9BACT|nr:5-oxoprolinase subunit PxpA [Lacibacter sediminis]QNA46309.1 LamB/YcsF family protein [Lacibacter sediminis]
MKSIDLNCDLGEGLLTDEQIIPLISSANIACGYHAGDMDTMKRTIELCLQHNVAIGAHPSWHDKENFGRTEMQKTAEEIYDIVTAQLFTIAQLAKEQGAVLHHVKPHGALYNQSAKDKTIAAAIAKAVYDFAPSLIMFGLSGSISLTEANRFGLQTAHEVFADRTYRDDGSLTPRSQPNALITDEQTSLQQILQLINTQTVTTVTEKIIALKADTICIHGDGSNAVVFAKTISSALKQNHIDIKAN